MMESIFFYDLRLWKCEVLLEFFWYFQMTKSVGQLNNCFWGFLYFFFSFSIVYFPCFKPFTAYLSFTKNFYMKVLLSICQFYQSNILYRNFCGANFLEFCEFWSIPRELVPDKFFSNVSVARKWKAFEVHFWKFARD